MIRFYIISDNIKVHYITDNHHEFENYIIPSYISLLKTSQKKNNYSISSIDLNQYDIKSFLKSLICSDNRANKEIKAKYGLNTTNIKLSLIK